MKKLLQVLAVIFNMTVLTLFGFMAFLAVDDGQAGPVTSTTVSRTCKDSLQTQMKITQVKLKL